MIVSPNKQLGGREFESFDKLCETRSQTTSACSAYSASGTWTQCRVLLGFTPTAVAKGKKAIQQRLDNKVEAAAGDHLMPPCLKTLHPISRRKETQKKTKLMTPPQQ